ncbi:LysM peptidoglycan-binding domain-containing protein [Aquidulcibacter sp.]|uniref:LysM peptidoglycan-binding domain-containing protein n=1 Tax=Aquidulcibacter sp. TaxID=2052990 RepID=UPI0037BF49AC
MYQAFSGYRNANAYTGRIGEGQGAVWGTNTSSTTTYTYEWYQGAVQTGITYKEGSATRITTFTMANIAGQMVTKSVLVNDGRARTVTFDTDVSGQVIRRRESDNNYSQGDPSAMWYRFAGRQMGMITNNGGWEGSYAASVAQRQAAPATTAPGAFANGATVGKQEEQFSSNLEVINSYSQGSVAGSYVVRSGDSLQGIAQNLWGDSGLWYKLAEANGLSGAASLFEGQTLRLPAGVMRNTYNASSVTPYNPAETLGDVTPSTPQAVPPKKQKCGGFGQIFLAIIAIAVTVMLPGGGFIATAISGAIGSIVSQTVGVAIGIQDKFSWKAVAMAAITAGVDGGLANKFGTGFTAAVARSAASSAISQGINVALGLQDKFSWAAVAASAVGAGVGYKVGNSAMLSKASGQVVKAAVSTTTMLTNAATRSLIDGSDFGDNVLSALPSVLGSMIFDGLASILTPKNSAELRSEIRQGAAKRYGEGAFQLASNDLVLPRTAEVVIVTASGQDKKNWFTIAMERFEQDVRNLRMGITDAIQSGINRGNNAVGSFKVQSRAAVQRIGGEVRSFGGVVTSAYLNRVDSGISRMRSGDATARAFENNTGFTGTIGRFGGGLEGVNGVIEYGLAAPLSAVDVLVGRPLNTATNNAIPQKFMGDAALTIAGAASLRPTATAARATVAAETVPARLAQDLAISPNAPSALPLGRPIGLSPTQNAAVQADIIEARAAGGTRFRVNQQQVDAAGNRVGINRPDLQYTDASGRRVYIEYDTPSSTRGPDHQTRIMANDPAGNVILKTVR